MEERLLFIEAELTRILNVFAWLINHSETPDYTNWLERIEAANLLEHPVSRTMFIELASDVDIEDDSPFLCLHQRLRGRRYQIVVITSMVENDEPFVIAVMRKVASSGPYAYNLTINPVKLLQLIKKVYKHPFFADNMPRITIDTLSRMMSDPEILRRPAFEQILFAPSGTYFRFRDFINF